MINEKYIPLTDRNKNNIFENFLLNKSVNSEEQEKKKVQKSFHEIIQKNKDTLLKLYSDIPVFKEILPQIKKSSKGTPFYHSLIKKDIKKTSFFKDI